jgi:hypothetical protein
MISARVVELAAEYLGQSADANGNATLVGLLWYVDSRDKSVPNADEVNAALQRQAGTMVARSAGVVSFSQSGTSHTITEADLRTAYEQYRAEFAALLRKASDA